MIIITGASRGIGAFLVKSYHETGEEITGIYKGSADSELPVYDNVRMVQLDISDYEKTEAWFKTAGLEGKDITLINCAGINYNSFGHKADIASWKNVIEVNLVATFNLIRLCLPFMREKGWGRIINMSSVVSQKGIPGTSAYAASKAALN